jgi:hypothetical protein
VRNRKNCNEGDVSRWEVSHRKNARCSLLLASNAGRLPAFGGERLRGFTPPCRSRYAPGLALLAPLRSAVLFRSLLLLAPLRGLFTSGGLHRCPLPQRLHRRPELGRDPVEERRARARPTALDLCQVGRLDLRRLRHPVKRA